MPSTPSSSENPGKPSPLTERDDNVIIEDAKEFDDWRDMLRFSQSSDAIRHVLSDPKVEETIWQHYYNQRFPGLPFPGNPSEATYKQAFIARHALYENAIRNNIRLNEQTPAPLRGDRDFVLSAVKQDGLALGCIPEHFKSDRTVVLLAVAEESGALQFASDALRSDKAIVLTAAKQNAQAFQFASEALKADRNFVLEAVKQDSYAFRYAADALKTDRTFALEAIKQSESALKFVPVAFKNDRAFILEAVRLNGLSLQFAPAFKNDPEIVVAATEQNVASLQHASPEMQEKYKTTVEEINQKALMVTSLFQSNDILSQMGKEAADELQKSILALAVSKQDVFSADTLERKVSALSGEYDEAIKLVQADGLNLQHLPLKMKANQEVVLAAVQQNGLALEHTTHALKNNPNVVLAAVKQDGLSLQHASDALRADETIVSAAIEQNETARQYALGNLDSNPSPGTGCIVS